MVDSLRLFIVKRTSGGSAVPELWIVSAAHFDGGARRFCQTRQRAIAFDAPWPDKLDEQTFRNVDVHADRARDVGASPIGRWPLKSILGFWLFYALTVVARAFLSDDPGTILHNRSLTIVVGIVLTVRHLRGATLVRARAAI